MGNGQRRDPHSRDWLLQMAEAEDQYPWIGVGGLAAEAGFIGPPTGEIETPFNFTSLSEQRPASRVVFARFLDLARRSKDLSLESLAERANVDLSELVGVLEEHAQPTPRTVYQLSAVLGVPNEKLMELAGLIEPREEMAEAAIRFAARSEPTVELSRDERLAFEEFVKVLVEKSDGR